MPKSIIPKSRTTLKSPPTGRLVASPGAKSAIVSGIDDELIKILPELGRAAYLRGLGTPFLIWSLLRSLDRAGTRYIERETATRYLGRNNVTRRKLRHAVELQQRLGITLFTIDSTKIAYVGQKKLAAALGVTRAVRPQMICRGAAQSMGSFWPAVYAAWLAAVGDKNGGAWISRARLTELWGIGATQQRKWEQSEHVSVQHNVGRFITPAEGDESEDTKRILATLPRDKDGESHSWERGEQTYYQTVNCYRPRFAMSTPMGATRKAAKYASDSTEAVEIVATARGKDQRVFFSQAWFKANSWHMRDEGSSLQEAPGERIVTRRKRRNPGTGLLDPYSTKFSVFDACSLRPCLRGAKL